MSKVILFKVLSETLNKMFSFVPKLGSIRLTEWIKRELGARILDCKFQNYDNKYNRKSKNCTS